MKKFKEFVKEVIKKKLPKILEKLPKTARYAIDAANGRITHGVRGLTGPVTNETAQEIALNPETPVVGYCPRCPRAIKAEPDIDGRRVAAVTLYLFDRTGDKPEVNIPIRQVLHITAEDGKTYQVGCINPSCAQKLDPFDRCAVLDHEGKLIKSSLTISEHYPAPSSS